MDIKKKGLIPPKLNSPLLILGFTPIEAILLVGLVILFGITFISTFIVMLGIISLLLCRIDGENNILSQLIIRYKFYTTPQEFDTKGVQNIYEYITNSTYHK